MALLRSMASNAYRLCVVYLLAGLALDGVRRLLPFHRLQVLSLWLDSLPARTLEVLGAMGPLREAYLDGRIGERALRVIFSSTTLAIICLLAVAVGSLTALLRTALVRRA